MYNVESIGKDIAEKLDKWGLDHFDGDPNFLDFLQDALFIMGGDMEDRVHRAVFCNEPKKLSKEHGKENLPDGVSYVWDLGDVVGLDFGDFEVDYWQLGEYLTKNGWARKAVVYYM